jgi:hypothetical protein
LTKLIINGNRRETEWNLFVNIIGKAETKVYAFRFLFFFIAKRSISPLIFIYIKSIFPLTVEESRIASKIGRRGRMVKAVVGDEAQIKAFEEALSSSSPQAQVSEQRRRLLLFLPLPSNPQP